MLMEFRNEPMLDFSLDSIRHAQQGAIAHVEAMLGQEHALLMNGEQITTVQKFKSLDPSNAARTVGIFQKADRALAERAVEVAASTFETWRWVPTRERAAVLLKTASLLRQRRFQLNAILMIEAGKPWAEADAETAEAIDFCEFYAREALRHSATQPLTPFAGEIGELKYIPLGVGAIIPPWNFSLAILLGMAAAALVTGNTVVIKPSSDAPLIATTVVELLELAGAPAGCVTLLTGPGAEVGEALVTHPKTRFVAFTGSREVGLRIHELAAHHAPGQRWLKRAILEMGGKDFTLVDSEADLDDAVAGVVAGAFGYSGQKCSACSRAIVDIKVYDEFLTRIAPLVDGLAVGPAKSPETAVGPVINHAAMKKIAGYIEVGRHEGRLLAGGGQGPAEGYFLQPTVFADVAASARIAREEIFGPVLAVMPAKNFDDAIRLANDTEYGLTGSFYTRNRQKIAQGRRVLHCGNLYVNRKCTGALVGVHPFGGFQMSGTDSKAGGRDYLLLFTQAKVIAERV